MADQGNTPPSPDPTAPQASTQAGGPQPAGTGGAAPPAAAAAAPPADALADRAASCPYVGPRSFQPGERMYGRDRETNTLVDLVIASRIVLLYSPSGAGKSSLINAALLPRLQEQGFTLLHVMRVNQEIPRDLPIPAGFNRYIFSALLSLEEGLARERRYDPAALAAMTFDDYLTRRCAEDQAAGQDMSTVLLVFDQFEEIVTTDPTAAKAKEDFFNQVGIALRDRTRWALFSMREDYIAGLDPYLRYLPTRLATRFRLDLLDASGARQAIQEPARAAGVEFDTDAADALIADLSQVQVQQPDGSFQYVTGLYVEPVQLQVVCSKLWLSLPPSTTRITKDDLKSIGDINQALAQYYDLQVSAVAARLGISEREIRKWFDEKLIVNENIRVQVPLGQTETAGLDNRAVFAFDSAYLIRSEKRGGTTWFELSHDRLVQPIRNSNAEWFKNNLSLLQRQAELWQTHNQSDGLLLSGKVLEEAQQWAVLHETEMELFEKTFLDRSLEAREEMAKERRFNRRIRYLAIISTVLFFAAVVGVIVSVRLRNEASRQAQLASAREISLAAVNNMNIDTERSVLLALAAIDKTGPPQNALPSSIEALHQALQANRLERILLGHDNNVTAAAYSPDGAKIATGSYDGEVILWSADTGVPLWLQNKFNNQIIQGVAFTPDGASLLVAARDGTVTRWDITSGQLLKTYAGQGTGMGVTVSPDGKLVAEPLYEGGVWVWQLADGQLFRKVSCTDGPVSAADFDPRAGNTQDSLYLALACDQYGVEIWNIANNDTSAAPAATNTSDLSLINSIHYSPDGENLVTASDDGYARVYDAANANLGYLIFVSNDSVMQAVFTRDGGTVLAASSDRSIRLYQLLGDGSSNQSFGLYGHSNRVYSLAVSPDGIHVVSGGQDKTVRIWDISPSGSHEYATIDTGAPVYHMALSTTGRQMAVSRQDNGVDIWALDQPGKKPLASLKFDTEASTSGAAYSPDGRYLAADNYAGEAAVWNATAPYQRVWLRKGATAPPFSAITFDHDSSRLVLGDIAGRVSAWSAADGAELRTMTCPAKAPIQDCTVTALDVAPQSQPGVAVAGYENGMIALWNLDDGSLLQLFSDVSYETIQGIHFSPDGKQIASASSDGRIDILDYIPNSNTATWTRYRDNHTSIVYSVAFSPDGKWLASGGGDLVTRLWSEPGVDPQMVLYGHSNAVSAVVFSPNSRYLYTGSLDGTIRDYLLDPQELVDLARSRLHRSLTSQECLLYLHADLCPTQ